MYNYATKSYLENATYVNTTQFAEKDDLANLKLEGTNIPKKQNT